MPKQRGKDLKMDSLKLGVAGGDLSLVMYVCLPWVAARFSLKVKGIWVRDKGTRQQN